MNSIYDKDIFEPIDDDLEKYINRFTMSPALWSKFSISDLPHVDFLNWKREKLIQNGCFSSSLSSIPTQYGGIYIYCIEPGIVPNLGGYVMYIGKATKTTDENLRARVKSYAKYISDSETRPRLYRLFHKWGEYVYVHFLPVDSTDEEITALEDRLIAAYGKPPCNSDVRIKSVKIAVRAFE